MRRTYRGRTKDTQGAMMIEPCLKRDAHRRRSAQLCNEPSTGCTSISMKSGSDRCPLWHILMRISTGRGSYPRSQSLLYPRSIHATSSGPRTCEQQREQQQQQQQRKQKQTQPKRQKRRNRFPARSAPETAGHPTENPGTAAPRLQATASIKIQTMAPTPRVSVLKIHHQLCSLGAVHAVPRSSLS
jgi:hypothetical protein